MAKTLLLLVLLGGAHAAAALELELGYGHERLTGGYADWRAAYLETAWSGADHAGATLLLRALDRYDRHDLEVGAGGTIPWGRGWAATLEGSASATHEFVPAFGAGGSLQRTLPAGFVGAAGARWSRYRSDGGASDVGTGSVVVERYWGAQRLGWTGYLATVAGSWSGSQRLAWDLYFRAEDRVGLGVAAGKELESAGGAAPVVTDVVAATISGRNALGGGWAITWELGVARQGERYTRMGGRVGVRARF